MGILSDRLNSHYFRDGSPIRTKWRLARFNAFLDHVVPPPNAKIIDLGGSSGMWELAEHGFHVTLVNLPGSFRKTPLRKGFTLVEADATNLHNVFASKSFDVVYSNSVIEHVGDETLQNAFAAEVHRLADAFWIQTPSSRFPLEVHTRVPLYWQLPDRVREHLMAQWERRLPAWAEMIKGTRVLTEERMRQLFPTSQVYFERSFGLEKSYCFYRSCRC